MPRGRKPKNPAEPSAEKKVREKKAPVARKKRETASDATKKFIYVFFNCDEEKSHDSMNIFYNHAAYKGTASSRKVLWKKLLDEELEGRIQFMDKEAVSKAVLSGNPQEASQFIKFGAIEAIPCE